MKHTEVSLRALVEREFNLGFTQVKDDSRAKYIETPFCITVARNFCWALLSKKGTVE